ncbi:MAG: SoxR reducing system RseC family protein [Nitrospirae bacterium]|nr:SoxR reducing system RseC family protein [Nitrospirota bacterium]MCL5422985.1 SoxR reducing system RseC family protein [Nitrospirota bacterium]
MKPTVPETGMVIKLDRDMAVVLLQGGESCKGCGAAAIGLCKSSGMTATLTVRNTKHAIPGDTVTVALDRGIQRRGFLLAYGIPIICFFGGSLLGYVIGKEYSIPSLEVITGFASLLSSAAWSLRKLRKLDKSSSMMIKEIVARDSFGLEQETSSVGS